MNEMTNCEVITMLAGGAANKYVYTYIHTYIRHNMFSTSNQVAIPVILL